MDLSNRIAIPKWLCFVLGLLFLGTCLAVGLVVHYAGPPGHQCPAPGQGPGGPAAPATGAKSSKSKVRDVLLPRHLNPINYKLELVPFIIPDNFTIRGSVEIEVACLLSSSNITLHAADLQIENDTIRVVDEDSRDVGVRSVEYDQDREFVILQLASQLQPGRKYKVTILYTAFLRDNLKGFYRSVYKDPKTGEDEYIAVTQFQAVDARRAFPCFDEPALKATYEVSLGRKTDMSSISNMPIQREGVAMEGSQEYVWDVYQQSVKMSTYLVAFVVSKFKFVEETRDNGVRFRIWTEQNSLDQAEYARDIGPKILEYFEEYFNVKFPLPKQDMIAIPDFGAGAMENWGLITYRETALLYKDGVSSVNNKQRIATVVSHELAHQWFGNLVTPSWWTDLWLNEGFASYVEYLGVEAIQPELKLLEQFVISDLQNVMGIDALETSHPINQPVSHPSEIQELFDRISYAKGASIIRMMDKFLTTETFRKGLSNYLTALAYEAAEQDDLWRHLTEQAHKDGTLDRDVKVKEIMDTWTLQMGYPLITVRRNYDARTARVSQQRFLVGNSQQSSESSSYSWWVPLTFSYPEQGFNKTYSKTWLKKGEESRQVSGLPESLTPVIFNVQQTGYYRVNYDKKNWELIRQQLIKDHTSIHVINRAQILNDALNLAKSGHLDYETALGMTEYLSNEMEYIPWSAALTGLSYINKMMKRTPAYGDFKRYMLNLVSPLYRKLGFNPRAEDSHLDIKLRAQVVSWACSMGHTDCLYTAGQNFNSWMGMVQPDAERANPIDVNLKYETYCNAIAAGSEKEWDFAWDRYLASSVASEKSTILSSLSCSKEVWLLNRYLNMSLTADSGVRKQDGYKVMGGVGRKTIGRTLTWDFVRDNWDSIKSYYSGFAATFIGRTIKYTTSSFTTKFELQQLKEFQESRKSELGSSTRDVEQAVESVENNVAWMERNYDNILNWLKKKQTLHQY